VFNSVDLIDPFKRFFAGSKQREDGLDLYTQKAGDVNDREGVYRFGVVPGHEAKDHDLYYNPDSVPGVTDLFECMGMHHHNIKDAILGTTYSAQNPVNIYAGSMQFLELSIDLLTDGNESLKLPSPLAILPLPNSRYALPIYHEYLNPTSVEIPRPLANIRGHNVLFKEVVLNLKTLRPQTLMHVSRGYVNIGLEFRC